MVTARDGNGTLIGLARVLSDDVAVMCLQDVLVRPDRQGEGIGRVLLEHCLDRFGHVRQKVLPTDDEERRHRLYRAAGYRDVAEIDRLHASVRPDNLDEAPRRVIHNRG